jgi:restriction system protein
MNGVFKVLGKSHDGGVDGIAILQLNPFVSFDVAFQCKRYLGAVSREQVAGFRGSKKAQHADKLIFITTGYFTREAIKEAKGEGAVAVELVDGERLVSLFEERQLGLRREEVFKVDHAFFEQFRQLAGNGATNAPPQSPG